MVSQVSEMKEENKFQHLIFFERILKRWKTGDGRREFLTQIKFNQVAISE